VLAFAAESTLLLAGVFGAVFGASVILNLMEKRQRSLT
jgi:hypothetical protein